MTLGQDMAQRIIDKGVPSEKVVVVPDWVDCRRIHPIEMNPFRRSFGDNFVVMYSGNHSPCHPLDTLLEAAGKLRNDAGTVFCFVGGGSEFRKVELVRREVGFGNVMCLPYQPLAELAGSLWEIERRSNIHGFVWVRTSSHTWNVASEGSASNSCRNTRVHRSKTRRDWARSPRAA